MTEPTRPQAPTTPPAAEPDALVVRYHEAAELLAEQRPDAQLRAAILAQAQLQAWKHADAAGDDDDVPPAQEGQRIAIEPVAATAIHTPAVGDFSSELPLPASGAAEATNDRRWRVPAIASVTVLGLAGLLAMQFERSPEGEQAAALGRPHATQPAASAAETSAQAEASGPSHQPPSPEVAPAAPAPWPTSSTAPGAPSADQRPNAPGGHPPAQPRATKERAASAASESATAPRADSLDRRAGSEPAARRKGASEAHAPSAADANAREAMRKPGAKPDGRAPANAAEPANPRPAAPARTPLPNETLTTRGRQAAAIASGEQAAAARTPPREAGTGSPANLASGEAISAADASPALKEDTGSLPPPPTPWTLAPDQHAGALSARPPAPERGGGEAVRPPALTPAQRLLAAATQGHSGDARQALADGAPVDAADATGRTALMLAARRGNVELARLLTQAGADPRRADGQGSDAIAYARRAGHEALARFLEQGRGSVP